MTCSGGEENISRASRWRYPGCFSLLSFSFWETLPDDIILHCLVMVATRLRQHISRWGCSSKRENVTLNVRYTFSFLMTSLRNYVTMIQNFVVERSRLLYKTKTGYDDIYDRGSQFPHLKLKCWKRTREALGVRSDKKKLVEPYLSVNQH